MTILTIYFIAGPITKCNGQQPAFLTENQGIIRESSRTENGLG